MATTFAIVAVFVPIAFMSGIIGRFFFSRRHRRGAVLVSLFVVSHSTRCSPPCARSARLALQARAVARRFMSSRALHRVDASRLRQRSRMGAHAPQDVLAISLAAFVGSFALVPLIGTEFVPQSDQASFRCGSTRRWARARVHDSKVRQVEEGSRSSGIKLAMTTVGTEEDATTRAST